MKVVSICYLEEQLGINLFPQLSEEQKRNTYQLPLKATAVKANKPIEYASWDAESQCAEDVENSKLQAMQKQFSRSGGSTTDTAQTKSNAGAVVDANTQDAIVKQLIESLLQYILQLLK